MNCDNKKEFGKKGEDRVRGILMSHKAVNHLYGHLLSNVRVGHGKYTHEVDFVSITTRGIFVVEVKNWAGLVIGKVDDEKWVQKKRYETQKPRNPIKQNRVHANQIKKLISNGTKEFPIYPIVVMTQNNSPFCSEEIVNLDGMVPFINRIGIENLISEKDVDMIASLLKAYVKIDNVSLSAHIQNIKSRYGER